MEDKYRYVSQQHILATQYVYQANAKHSIAIFYERCLSNNCPMFKFYNVVSQVKDKLIPIQMNLATKQTKFKAIV